MNREDLLKDHVYYTSLLDELDENISEVERERESLRERLASLEMRRDTYQERLVKIEYYLTVLK